MSYVDSSIFLYPAIYDVEAIPKARRCRDFLVRMASGEVKAYTSLLT